MLSAAEVCVVGGGPAGLIVAEALASHGVDVVVLESGGETHDSGAQELSRGTVTGDAVSGYDLVATRRRQLGGNANAWSVKTTRADRHWTLGIRYGSLTDQDHESRSWIPRSGWPLPKEDLRKWTSLAHERFGDGPPDFDAEQASSSNGSSADNDVLFDRDTSDNATFDSERATESLTCGAASSPRQVPESSRMQP